MLTDVLVAVLLTASIATVQTPAHGSRGAKALFIDPHSGARLVPVAPRPKPPVHPGAEPRPPEPTGPGRELGPAVTQASSGLHYYVEVVEPTGIGRRVNSDRVFRSGERIRLHFVSNVSGRLALFQHRTDGTASMLFPHPQVSNGDDRIRAGADSVVPPGGAWLRFDGQVGVERLIVVFVAEDLGDAVRFAAAGSTLSASAAERLVASARACRGSKDLALEVAAEGTYVVGTNAGGCRIQGSKDLTLELGPAKDHPGTQVPNSTGSSFTVATEIMLHHAP